jgi:cytoskeletal protein CcmA (bactofilin family)
MPVFKKKDEANRTGKPGYQHDRTPTTSTSSQPDTRISSSPTSIIGKTIFVKGSIFSDEEVFIEGKIEGQLNIKHRVVVGKGGIVNADIEAREVIVKGTVNGNVKGNYKVEIVPDGVVNGNIVSRRVVLAEGAIFKGNIDMPLKE